MFADDIWEMKAMIQLQHKNFASEDCNIFN